MGSSSHFPTGDKLRGKSDYHGWKMSLDLTLEEQEVLDYVKGKIPKPRSNAPAATKSKYNKAEVKAKKIIRYSIDKHLVAYISNVNTSKKIYDRLVSMLKTKLKDIRKGKDEDIQYYFLRITKIKNDLLAIREIISHRELTITTLGGLPPKWYIFRTIILNNDRIPRFEELMSRCIQEETRMVEQEMHFNTSNPTTSSTHVKRRNNAGNKGHFHGKPGSKGRRKGKWYNDKGKRNVGHQGNGRPSKKARNSRYGESNAFNNKQKEYYLISALSTTSPLDTLGNWLIDSGTSRHFTGYKEALSNMIEKETNLEIILGDNVTYLEKGVGNVTLQLNQGNMIHLLEVLYVPDLKKNSRCPFRQWKTKDTK
eukprot:PITA_24459